MIEKLGALTAAGLPCFSIIAAGANDSTFNVIIEALIGWEGGFKVLAGSFNGRTFSVFASKHLLLLAKAKLTTEAVDNSVY